MLGEGRPECIQRADQTVADQLGARDDHLHGAPIGDTFIAAVVRANPVINTNPTSGPAQIIGVHLLHQGHCPEDPGEHAFEDAGANPTRIGITHRE
jgi:hypothetical protein